MLCPLLIVLNHAGGMADAFLNTISGTKDGSVRGHDFWKAPSTARNSQCATYFGALDTESVQPPPSALHSAMSCVPICVLL